MASRSVSAIEQPRLSQLGTLDNMLTSDAEIGLDSRAPEHEAYPDFLLLKSMGGEVRVRDPEQFVGDAQ